MSHSFVPNKRYFKTISTDIKTICEPLQQFGIIYFGYAKIYDDGTVSALVTHGDSLFHHWKKGYPFCAPLPPSYEGKKIYGMPYLTTNLTSLEKKALEDYENLFNLGHPIYFLERQSDHTEYYCYATELNNADIINFYLSNIDILEKFKFYFKEKSNDLMKFPEKNRLLLPQQDHLNLEEKIMNRHNKKNILHQFDAQHYSLSLYGNTIILTKRELDVLKYLSQGCTIKEAAAMLALSPRTVEHYFENVKYKMGCNKKSEIIKIISEAKLFF